MNELRTGTSANVRKVLLTALLAVAIGIILVAGLAGKDPVAAFAALLRGAVVGKKNIGTTLVGATNLLLNAVAFTIAYNAGFFNTGIDGDMYMGALAATVVGIYCKDLPPVLLAILCIVAAVVAGALWALIPALLNIHLNVNVLCVCIFMNMVANYVCGFFVVGPLTAGKAVPQSKEVGVRFPGFLKPSSLNIGIFFAIAITIVVYWMMKKTAFGREIKTVGENRLHAEYAGISRKRLGVKAMLLSGAIAGFSGCIEILGNTGYFMQSFAAGLGSRGLLVAMLVRCNIVLLPLSAFFISALNTGAVTMQAATRVPKSLGDTLTAALIVLFCMETLFMRKSKGELEKDKKRMSEESRAENAAGESETREVPAPEPAPEAVQGGERK